MKYKIAKLEDLPADVLRKYIDTVKNFHDCGGDFAYDAFAGDAEDGPP